MRDVRNRKTIDFKTLIMSDFRTQKDPATYHMHLALWEATVMHTKYSWLTDFFFILKNFAIDNHIMLT